MGVKQAIRSLDAFPRAEDHLMQKTQSGAFVGTVVDRPEGVLVLAVASLGEKVVEVTIPMFMLLATLASSMFSAIRDRVNFCRLVLHFLQRNSSRTKTHVFSTKTREVL